MDCSTKVHSKRKLCDAIHVRFSWLEQFIALSHLQVFISSLESHFVACFALSCYLTCVSLARAIIYSATNIIVTCNSHVRNITASPRASSHDPIQIRNPTHALKLNGNLQPDTSAHGMSSNTSMCQFFEGLGLRIRFFTSRIQWNIHS